ncbi:MAG: transcriptional regulator PpsR [Pseudomonadota bacterium]
MIPFKSHQHALGELGEESVAEILGASQDVTLLLNQDGTIIDVAYGGDRPLNGLGDEWLGKPWRDTVTSECYEKIEKLLGDAASANGKRRWRQVNHPNGQLADVPILYLAVQPRDSELIIAVGKDLRPISDMQQQLMDMQHSIENEYVRLQQAETRYRVLFQHTGEAILITDPSSSRVLEANPAAATLLNTKPAKLVGRALHQHFAEDTHALVNEVLASVRATGKEDRVRVALASEDRELWLSATLLQRDNSRLLMLRLISDDQARQNALHAEHEHRLLALVEHTSDGVVTTDEGGLVKAANAAFLEMCQVASEPQMLGQPLDTWLGRPGVDVNVLRKNLTQRGQVRQFQTLVNVEYGGPVDVELSAALLPHDAGNEFGYIVRRVSRAQESRRQVADDALPQSMEQMTDLVGRVPLKDLVRETTDILEKLCIQAALKLTDNNRASAADMLGLSRQSLYVKLRRFGLQSDEDEE